MITDPERRRQYFRNYMREYRKNKPVKPVLKFKEVKSVKPRMHFSKATIITAKIIEVSPTYTYMIDYTTKNISIAMKKLDGADHEKEIIHLIRDIGNNGDIIKAYHWYRLAHCKPETIYDVILLLQKALKDNDIETVKAIRGILKKGVEYTDSVIRIAQNENVEEVQ